MVSTVLLVSLFTMTPVLAQEGDAPAPLSDDAERDASPRGDEPPPAVAPVDPGDAAGPTVLPPPDNSMSGAVASSPLAPEPPGLAAPISGLVQYLAAAATAVLTTPCVVCCFPLGIPTQWAAIGYVTSALGNKISQKRGGWLVPALAGAGTWIVFAVVTGTIVGLLTYGNAAITSAVTAANAPIGRLWGDMSGNILQGTGSVGGTAAFGFGMLAAVGVYHLTADLKAPGDAGSFDATMFGGGETARFEPTPVMQVAQRMAY